MARDNERSERTGAHDEGAVIHRARYDRTSERSLSTEVVRAVAAAAGTCPTGLDDRLGDTIDADAIDDLFEPTAGTSEAAGRGVWFEFSGFEVVVRGSGEIEVRSRGRRRGRREGRTDGSRPVDAC